MSIVLPGTLKNYLILEEEDGDSVRSYGCMDEVSLAYERRGYAVEGMAHTIVSQKGKRLWSKKRELNLMGEKKNNSFRGLVLSTYI